MEKTGKNKTASYKITILRWHLFFGSHSFQVSAGEKKHINIKHGINSDIVLFVNVIYSLSLKDFNTLYKQLYLRS